MQPLGLGDSQKIRNYYFNSIIFERTFKNWRNIYTRVVLKLMMFLQNHLFVFK